MKLTGNFKKPTTASRSALLLCAASGFLGICVSSAGFAGVALVVWVLGAGFSFSLSKGEK
jgi:hypothetical protein